MKIPNLYLLWQEVSSPWIRQSKRLFMIARECRACWPISASQISFGVEFVSRICLFLSSAFRCFYVDISLSRCIGWQVNPTALMLANHGSAQFWSPSSQFFFFKKGPKKKICHLSSKKLHSDQSLILKHTQLPTSLCSCLCIICYTLKLQWGIYLLSFRAVISTLCAV